MHDSRDIYKIATFLSLCASLTYTNDAKISLHFIDLLVQWCAFENQQNRVHVENWNFSRCPDRYQKCCYYLALLIHIYHYWELSNEVLYDHTIQGVSKVPVVKIKSSRFTWQRLNFKLWLVIFLISLDVQSSTKSHWKDLSSGNMSQEGLDEAALLYCDIEKCHINSLLLILKCQQLYFTLFPETYSSSK